ncbi:hypothetical protein T492DRAFT_1059965 [Pavlovales sp. CCMP2436]|nr:hypothetical protein T492DRAFT_1059965 [Pavlovales sp. CCMP2436]
MLAVEAVQRALRAFGASAATCAYATGAEGSPGSSLCAALVIFLFYSVAIRLLYYGVGALMQRAAEELASNCGTGRTPTELRRLHRAESEAAFFLYPSVAFLSEWFQLKGLSRTCMTISECGGPAQALLNTVVWFFVFELGVFLVHWGVLHKLEWGKRAFKHSRHHAAKRSTEMTVWTGFAFEAIDGTLQGLPLPLAQLLVPVPYQFVTCLGLVLGLWTMYIHIGIPHLPWPLMGADYHFLHHKFNSGNYGMFTVLWDTVFGTIKYPTPENMQNTPNKAQ